MEHGADEYESTTDGSPAFESLWQRYHKPLTWFVSGYVRGSRNGDRATQVADAVQEIMFKVYRALGRFDGRRCASTWVYAIARNHCVDLGRRSRARARTVAYDDMDSLPNTRVRGPESEVLTRELETLVDSFIDTLEPDDRTTLMLRFYEELSYAEIARAVKRPEGTVKYRIHEIKRQLRAYLEERQ